MFGFTSVSLRLQLALWWAGLTALIVTAVGFLAYAAESLTLYTTISTGSYETARSASPPPTQPLRGSLA